jgi:cell fate regulator YaaT (PSP1 superfamily)
MDKMVAFVRYGAMEMTERFSAPDTDIPVGSDVIVRTPRGVEWGLLVQFRKRISEAEEIVGELLRKVTPVDRDKLADIVESRQVAEFETCEELIKKHELPMKLVEVEHLFGGHKIIFYFMADGRVDFRELVRDLAKEYRTRIEMRQIGVRDEARLRGMIGPCGSEICCRRFLKALKPVPMKLAKDQKSTLDPAKISGSCGRLKCCLKYEEDLYRELKYNLPRRGAHVHTAEGEGQVVDYEIIGQTVTVLLEDGRRHRFPADKVRNAPEKQ